MLSVASLKPPRHITDRGYDFEGDKETFWSKVGEIRNVPAHFSPAEAALFVFYVSGISEENQRAEGPIMNLW